MLKKYRQQAFLFLMALSIVIGPGYNMYLHYDFSHTIDTKTYLAIAGGDFKDQSLTRRYRVIVPFIAEAVSYPISLVYKKLWPQRPQDQWPLRLAFYIVNSILVAITGVVIFYACRAYNATVLSAFIGMMAILCSRWTNYTVGLPMTDSLYMLIIALTIYGIKTRNNAIQLFCIFVGPFAKESFIFIAPIIFFLGSIPKWKQLIYFLVAGAMVFGLRYWIDMQAGSNTASSLQNDIAHTENWMETFQRIFAVRGLGELFTIMGTFTFMMLAGFLGGKAERKSWMKELDWACGLLLISLIVHAVLSIEVSRMLYFGSVLWAIVLALVLDRHKYFKVYRQIFGLEQLNNSEPESGI
jgi:uncharacterized membrane protein YjjB (DUF3815 family)